MYQFSFLEVIYWFTYIILLSLSKWLPSLRRIMLFRKVHKSWCSLYTLFLKPRHQSTAWPHFTPAPLCPSKLTWPNRKTKNLMLLHEKRFHEAYPTETWFTISHYHTAVYFLKLHYCTGIFLFTIGLWCEEICIKNSCRRLTPSLYLLWFQKYEHNWNFTIACCTIVKIKQPFLHCFAVPWKSILAF